MSRPCLPPPSSPAARRAVRRTTIPTMPVLADLQPRLRTGVVAKHELDSDAPQPVRLEAPTKPATKR